MKKGFRILKFKKDNPIFEVKDISKSFNGRPVLKKLSLKVFPGECVGILGPNGCGKTTLFSMCLQGIDARVLGPAKPPVHKVKNWFSRKIYIKSPNMGTIIKLFQMIDQSNVTSRVFFTPNPLN